MCIMACAYVVYYLHYRRNLFYVHYRGISQLDLLYKAEFHTPPVNHSIISILAHYYGDYTKSRCGMCGRLAAIPQ